MSTGGATKAAVSVHLVGGDYLTSLALRQLEGAARFENQLEVVGNKQLELVAETAAVNS